MSNKNLILIFGLGLLLIGGLFYFWFSSQKTQTSNTNTFTKNEPTLNPFGNTSGNKDTGTSSLNGSNGQGGSTQKNLSQLIQIYKNPTSGLNFILNKSNQNDLMFVDRATGNTYEYIPDTQTGEASRLTNTTIPKVQESVWSNNGENLIYRYLDNDTDNIVSFNAKINRISQSSDNPGSVTGSFLAQNIKQLVINPKGDKIFNLIDKSDKSGTYGYTTNIDGSSKKAVFESPISYWNVSWPKDNIITFTTKPMFRDFGMLYFFNTQTSSMERILSNFAGLTTLTNKDASLVAYSYSTNNFISLDVYDVKNKISRGLNILTLSDKCVWGNTNTKVLYCAIPENPVAGNYPDVWYQGLQLFTDNIWKIDTDTGAISLVYEVGLNESTQLDATDIKISPDDKYIAFSNKYDLSLWLLSINQQQF